MESRFLAGLKQGSRALESALVGGLGSWGLESALAGGVMDLLSAGWYSTHNWVRKVFISPIRM